MESVKKMLEKQIKGLVGSAEEDEDLANGKELEVANLRMRATRQRAEAAELQRLLDTYDK